MVLRLERLQEARRVSFIPAMKITYGGVLRPKCIDDVKMVLVRELLDGCCIPKAVYRTAYPHLSVFVLEGSDDR